MSLSALLKRWRKRQAERAAARSIYEVVIYYNGPRTQWSGKVVDNDVITRLPVRFLWLARIQANSLIGQLNQGRCGYVILRDGALAEEYLPPPVAQE